MIKEGSQSSVRVLVVEDNDFVREGLVALLNHRGLQVAAQARDGVEAVALYGEHRPDVTLMDLQMPRMDGLTAIRQITAQFPQARIVVLTSQDDAEQACFDAGALAVLRKDEPSRKVISTLFAVSSGKATRDDT